MLEQLNGSLTPKQTRRVWRCLDRMKLNSPRNPMDTAARTRMAAENRHAAGKLASACMDSAEEEGATVVNEAIAEAESILGLEEVG